LQDGLTMGGWVEGDPVGDRVFLDLPAPLRLERGGVLPSVRVA
jgi:homoserine O-acetyltransferase/O-succinyltransferase